MTRVSHVAIVAIAKRHNRTVEDVCELWSERAAMREFEGGATREEAERADVEDVERMCREGAK